MALVTEEPEAAEEEASQIDEVVEASKADMEALQAENEQLKVQVAQLEDHNEELSDAIDNLEKAAKAKGKGVPPVKMEKPGEFFAKTFRLQDPYAERVFHADPTRPTPVRPMTSWVDCQIKAGILIRAKG